MKNPLRVFEFSNKNKNPPINAVDIPTNDITAWYFYKIHNLFCNRYKWENLPKEILPWMIESFLFYNGVGVFSVDDVTAMIAGQIGQLAPMDEETADLFQQLAKKMIEQAGKEI